MSGRLNEVRPGRPEQSRPAVKSWLGISRLNEVRPGRPEQSPPTGCVVQFPMGLNEVRPGRPEQSLGWRVSGRLHGVSMKSGLEDRNNLAVRTLGCLGLWIVSMKSGLEDRNNPKNPHPDDRPQPRLNEVRPGRPEQFHSGLVRVVQDLASQ